ncbi:MAG: type II secretion system secretin GspD [Deltaproteobacteria bacterium]
MPTPDVTIASLPTTRVFAWLLALALLLPPVAGAQANPAATAGPTEGQGKLSINFEEVSLPVFIKFVSRATGRNFVFSNKVSGAVSVVSPTPVDPDQAMAVLHSVLTVRGLTTVDDGAVIRIVPIKDARTAGAASLDPSGGGYTTRLLQLKHVDAVSIAATLANLASKEGGLSAYPESNTLIISDTAANVLRLSSLIKTLDMPDTTRNIAVIPLKHADAATVVDKLGSLLFEPLPMGQKGKPGPRLPTFRMAADQRTNSIVAKGSWAQIARVRALVAGIDKPLKEGEERIHVYHVRNANAEALVKVVRGVVYGRSTGVETAKGQAGARLSSGLAGNVAVTSDPTTNSVIVNASLSNFRTIRSLLENLDIQRPQVLVEAIIVEVTVDRSKEIGFEFQTGGDIGDGVGIGRASLANINAAMTNPASLSGLILAATSDRTIKLPDGSEVPAQVALFQALATDTDIEILSAPTLLTLDNEEAEIVVGQNVPFITSHGVDLSAISNVFTTVERRDVGIKLRITPQVSEGESVVLRVKVEVSAVIPSVLLDEAKVGPTTTIRSATTTVSVSNGRTAVIGGLISDVVTKQTVKVPLLGDLPFIGRFFRRDQDKKSKVNLIVFLTPHIIRGSEDLEAASRQQREQYRQSTRPTTSIPPPPPPSETTGADQFPLWPKADGQAP